MLQKTPGRAFHFSEYLRMIASPLEDLTNFYPAYDPYVSYHFRNSLPIGLATNLVSTSFLGISIAGFSALWLQRFFDSTEIVIRILVFSLYLFESDPAYRHYQLSQKTVYSSLLSCFAFSCFRSGRFRIRHYRLSTLQI